MWNYLWHTFFFDPVYNTLVFFLDIVPGHDVGLAIIFTTLVIKFILLPLSVKAFKTQAVMRELEPKLKEIKEKYKDKKEEQAKATLDLYRESKVNPFSSVGLILLQIPIIISLYFSVYSGAGGIALPEINSAILYSFVNQPNNASMLFLGIIDMAGKSLPLALLAGLTQFIQTRISFTNRPKKEPNKKGGKPDFKQDLQQSLQIQMRYVLPIIITIIAYTISSAIALYFVVSNLFSIVQDWYIKKRHVNN